MRQIAKFFWVLGLSAQVMMAYAAPARIEGLNFSNQANGRLIFDVNGAPHYRYFMLKSPSRLVIDFENTTLSQAIAQPPANHLAVGVRSATRNQADLRVVVELNADAEAKLAATNKDQGMQLQFDLSATAAPIASPAAITATPPNVQPAPNVAAVKSSPKAQKAAEKPVVKAAAKAAKGRDIVIAIDAGHGGKDVGAQGANGTQEKDVVFAIAKRLQSAVNRQPGMRAVMIRDGDYFVKLRKRVEIAQAAKADLFVSIHADAFDDPSAHGSSVYTLDNNGASSQVAQYLANSENASDRAGGAGDVRDDTLASVLMDLSNKAAKEASQHIGNRVLKSVNAVGHLHRKSVQKAGFVVLKSPIPSILVETAFISNPDEERRLNTRAYQDQMASAVFSGITAHFKRYAPAGTLFAQLQKSGKSATRLAAREETIEPAAAVVKSNEARVERVASVSAGSSKAQHVISRGETLSGIAQQYGVSMRELRHANDMDGGDVKIGQVLQIPRSS